MKKGVPRGALTYLNGRNGGSRNCAGEGAGAWEEGMMEHLVTTHSTRLNRVVD